MYRCMLHKLMHSNGWSYLSVESLLTLGFFAVYFYELFLTACITLSVSKHEEWLKQKPLR